MSALDQKGEGFGAYEFAGWGGCDALDDLIFDVSFTLFTNDGIDAAFFGEDGFWFFKPAEGLFFIEVCEDVQYHFRGALQSGEVFGFVSVEVSKPYTH